MPQNVAVAIRMEIVLLQVAIVFTSMFCITTTTMSRPARKTVRWFWGGPLAWPKPGPDGNLSAGSGPQIGPKFQKTARPPETFFGRISRPGALIFSGLRARFPKNSRTRKKTQQAYNFLGGGQKTKFGGRTKNNFWAGGCGQDVRGQPF